MNATKSIITVSMLTLVALCNNSCERSASAKVDIATIQSTLRVADAILHEFMGEDAHDHGAHQTQQPVQGYYPTPATNQPVYQPTYPAQNSPVRPAANNNPLITYAPAVIDAVLNRDSNGNMTEMIGGLILDKVLKSQGINF